jgi:adenylosuccinate lyase
MACVKAGMGREVAHKMIKKHATTNTASNFFTALTSEKDCPLTLNQLNDLIKSPADFAGSALEQSADMAERIKNVIKGEVSKVDLAELI